MYQKFKKKERLTHKKHVQRLFRKGKRHNFSLLKVYYLPSDENNHKALFSVPKKVVRKAVERNRIRRKISEAYRLSKHMIYKKNVSSKCFFIGYVYRGNVSIKPTYRKFLEEVKNSMLYIQKNHNMQNK